MSSYVIFRNNKPYSNPMATKEEAETKIEELSIIYNKESLSIVETDAEVIEVSLEPKTYEEVEDKSCAGGACTL